MLTLSWGERRTKSQANRMVIKSGLQAPSSSTSKVCYGMEFLVLDKYFGRTWYWESISMWLDFQLMEKQKQKHEEYENVRWRTDNGNTIDWL